MKGMNWLSLDLNWHLREFVLKKGCLYFILEWIIDLKRKFSRPSIFAKTYFQPKVCNKYQVRIKFFGVNARKLVHKLKLARVRYSMSVPNFIGI